MTSVYFSTRSITSSFTTNFFIYFANASRIYFSCIISARIHFNSDISLEFCSLTYWSSSLSSSILLLISRVIDSNSYWESVSCWFTSILRLLAILIRREIKKLCLSNEIYLMNNNNKIMVWNKIKIMRYLILLIYASFLELLIFLLLKDFIVLFN